ncbi:MAG: CbtA family protein [Carbonactinosporaceae bacterium]
MIGALFVRGLVAGLFAGLLAGGFAFAFGEPLVDRAIAIEDAAAHSAANRPDAAADRHAAEHRNAGASADAEDAPLVSRGGQKAGLFLALSLDGAAVGGLFALVYAAVRPRTGRLSEPALAVALAGALFVAVVLVPFLKYPANPPGVGDPDTIGMRTTSYLVMVAVGLLSLGIAAWTGRSVRPAASFWLRAGASSASFLTPVVVAYVALPAVDEVPTGFPATLLWDFRLASLGMQFVLWLAVGVLFAILCQRTTRTAKTRAACEESW